MNARFIVRVMVGLGLLGMGGYFLFHGGSQHASPSAADATARPPALGHTPRTAGGTPRNGAAVPNGKVLPADEARASTAPAQAGDTVKADAESARVRGAEARAVRGPVAKNSQRLRVGAAGDGMGAEAEPAAVPVARAVVAHVTLPGGEAQELTPNGLGMFPRVLVEPSTRIAVQVAFPEAEPGETVVLQMLDGGKLDNGKISKVMQLDARKTLAFETLVAVEEGTYRVALTRGADRKEFDFWVGKEAPVRR